MTTLNLMDTFLEKPLYDQLKQLDSLATSYSLTDKIEAAPIIVFSKEEVNAGQYVNGIEALQARLLLGRPHNTILGNARRRDKTVEAQVTSILERDSIVNRIIPKAKDEAYDASIDEIYDLLMEDRIESKENTGSWNRSDSRKSGLFNFNSGFNGAALTAAVAGFGYFVASAMGPIPKIPTEGYIFMSILLASIGAVTAGEGMKRYEKNSDLIERARYIDRKLTEIKPMQYVEKAA